MTFSRLDLLEILRYDTVVGSELTVIDRMFVHQYIAQKRAFTPVLQAKLLAIQNRISTQNWQLSKLRYQESDTGHLALQAYNWQTQQWEFLRKIKEK